MIENGQKHKPLNTHLKDIIKKIRRDLLDISSYAFSMDIATTISLGFFDNPRCFSLPNSVKPFSEIFANMNFVQGYLLEEAFTDEHYYYDVILVDEKGVKFGICLDAITNSILYKIVNEKGAAIYNRLNATNFRTLVRGLLDDAESLGNLVKKEVNDIQDVLIEFDYRSLTGTRILFEEGGDLLDGRYVGLEKIGEGQNGVVWKAREPNLNRSVAIKVLHQGIEGVTHLREFYSEIASQGKLLVHANTVPIFTVHDVVSPPFYVMEFVDGWSLEKHLQEMSLRNEWPTIEWSMQIIEDCLRGLAHAHNNSILHGDIKPGNIMITRNDEVKLSDFGCSKLLDASSIQFESYNQKLASLRASETYAAPEILKKEEIEVGNFSSDLFSLGLVMYILFTKTHPFLHPSGLVEIKDLIMQADYPAPQIHTIQPRIPEEKAEIITSLLEKNKTKRRFQEANEVLDVWNGAHAR